MAALTEKQIKVRKVTAWQASWTESGPVSYTHLTLPTILLV